MYDKETVARFKQKDKEDRKDARGDYGMPCTQKSLALTKRIGNKNHTFRKEVKRRV